MQAVLRRAGICGLLDSMSQTNCRLLPSVLALSPPFLECTFRVAHEPAIKLLRYTLLLFLRFDTLVVAPRRGQNAAPVRHIQTGAKSRQTGRTRIWLMLPPTTSTGGLQYKL